MTEKLQVKTEGHVLSMSLCRTDKKNAIDLDMLQGLAEAYTRLSDDPALRCGVLWAEGDVFTAGLDLAAALPRFVAGVISVPLLTAMFNALAILGAVVFSIGVMGLDSGIFWSKLQTSISFGEDFMGGVWKSVVFGGLVSLVAVYYGYSAKPTGAGVGTATTNTVVISSVLILIFDFILTSMFA